MDPLVSGVGFLLGVLTAGSGALFFRRCQTDVMPRRCAAHSSRSFARTCRRSRTSEWRSNSDGPPGRQHEPSIWARAPSMLWSPRSSRRTVSTRQRSNYRALRRRPNQHAADGRRLAYPRDLVCAPSKKCYSGSGWRSSMRPQARGGRGHSHDSAAGDVGANEARRDGHRGARADGVVSGPFAACRTPAKTRPAEPFSSVRRSTSRLICTDTPHRPARPNR